MHHTPTHPHAKVAIELAESNPSHRGHVNRELYLSGTPRSLYTLARLLRAAKLLDDIEAMNRSHPPIRYDPNAFGPGLGGILLGHAKAA